MFNTSGEFPSGSTLFQFLSQTFELVLVLVYCAEGVVWEEFDIYPMRKSKFGLNGELCAGCAKKVLFVSHACVVTYIPGRKCV